MDRDFRLVQLAKLGVCITAAWAFLGFFFASQEHAIATARRTVEDTNERALHTTAACIVWALLTPVVIYIADRLPLRAPRRGRNIGLVIGLGLVLALLRSLVDASLPAWLENAPLSPDEFHDTAVAMLHQHFFFFALIIGVTNFVRARMEADERARREVGIDAELVQAQLRRLRADLQPHFLFNTLNAVTALVHTDRRAAAETITRLIDLLRTSMDIGGRTEVPLAEELDFVGRYLDLQKLRFGDRLCSHIDVAHPDLLRVCVPPLLLQPLVENSVAHGIRKRPAGGVISVRAFRDHDALRLEVRDSGPGCEPEAPFNRGSIGVPNTRARLEYLYRDPRSLSFRRDGDEFVADIRIPLRFA